MNSPGKRLTTLLVSQSLSLAAGWPPHTPLTSQSLAAWLKKVCAAATCQQVKAGALVPSHTTQVFPESRVYVLTKAGQTFYLRDRAPSASTGPSGVSVPVHQQG